MGPMYVTTMNAHNGSQKKLGIGKISGKQREEVIPANPVGIMLKESTVGH